MMLFQITTDTTVTETSTETRISWQSQRTEQQA